MLLRFANSTQWLMDIKTIEITAVNIANLIYYDKLDGCVCYNLRLAEGITTVLTSLQFELKTKHDEIENLYYVWVKR